MENKYTLRHPVVSGLFYPDGKEELENNIDSYCDRVNKAAIYDKIREKTGFSDLKEFFPLVLVSPHAGYIFSGQIQAYSYILLYDVKVDTIVIIGPAHQKPFKGLSVCLDYGYETPLGIIEGDISFAKKLLAYSKGIIENEEAHLSEHAIEVQIPFIQKIQRQAKVVSVLFGEQSWDNSELLKDALLNVMNELKKRYIIIASSDLSHYHSQIDAKVFDNTLIRDIENMDPESFYANIRSRKSEACGFGGILTAMMYVRKVGRGKSVILRYMDSGEISGDKRRVVGYLSAVMF